MSEDIVQELEEIHDLLSTSTVKLCRNKILALVAKLEEAEVKYQDRPVVLDVFERAMMKGLRYLKSVKK